MPCKSCGSANQDKFSGEMGIHFPGLENIDRPVVWVFPKLVVCLDRGNAEVLSDQLNRWCCIDHLSWQRCSGM
jgi:hypothetical protein